MGASEFKGADAYGVFHNYRTRLTVILSEAKNLVVHREMRCFTALSMTWLRLLLTRLKFWMHPVAATGWANVAVTIRCFCVATAPAGRERPGG